MVAKTITKQLGGIEDLLLGEGNVSQERTNDVAVTINRLRLAAVVSTLTELKTLPINLPDTYYRIAVMTGSALITDGISGVYRHDATYNTLLANDSDIVLAAGSLGCWLLMDKAQQATAANFALLAAAVNTTQKYTGKMVWDSTNSKPVWATGQTAASVWVDSSGSTVYTPV